MIVGKVLYFNAVLHFFASWALIKYPRLSSVPHHIWALSNVGSYVCDEERAQAHPD